jgi:hypothetical protein
MMLKFLLAATALTAIVAPASSAVIMTYEAPGVTNTTETGTFAVEDFQNLPNGTVVSSTSGFTSTNLTQTISGVTFSYTGVAIKPGDQYGGANGSTYAGLYNGPYGGTNNGGAGYTLDVSSADALNYFGLYITASDDSNTFTFYNGNTVLGVFTLADLRASIGVADQGAFFANFNFTNGDTYTKVVFSQPVGCCGFESDNHTVGVVTDMPSGGVTLPVPEAATWAMMVAGFGLVGGAIRRRRPTVTFA